MLSVQEELLPRLGDWSRAATKLHYTTVADVVDDVLVLVGRIIISFSLGSLLFIQFIKLLVKLI